MSTPIAQQPSTTITENGPIDLPISPEKTKIESSQKHQRIASAPGNILGKGEGPVCVTVCGVTGEGEEVCVTVCEGGEGEKEQETKYLPPLPNGKPSSATFPRQNRHNHSFSSTHSGRLSPYESEHSSSSDAASLSQDMSLSASQQALHLQLVVEQLKQELLAQVSGGQSEEAVGGTDREELTKTLLEHVVTLKMELATLKEENEKLRHVRSNMDNEIHELTENLFEEAYKMVDEAKGSKVSAEKRLADAAGKIDAMETEMSTLKRLIHTPHSHSSSPKATSAKTHSLHPPQTNSPSHKPKRPSIKRAVHKIQKRTGIGITRSLSSSSTKGRGSPLMLLEHKGGMIGEGLATGEVDQHEYAQFEDWIKSLSPSTPSPTSPPPPHTSHHPYFTTILAQDIQPCLSFKNKELSKRVLQAVQDNSVVMESLNSSTNSNGRPGHMRSGSLPPPVGVQCALCEAKGRVCTHKMTLREGDQCLYISQSCRDRVASVCDFFMTLSHIQKGIIKGDTLKLYWQVARLRGLMQLSRYSLSLPSDPSTH